MGRRTAIRMTNASAVIAVTSMLTGLARAASTALGMAPAHAPATSARGFGLRDIPMGRSHLTTPNSEWDYDPMSIDRIKGNVAFFCDLNGCTESIETSTGDFSAANAEAKEEGWCVRKHDDEWKNFCCARHAEMNWRGQSLCR